MSEKTQFPSETRMHACIPSASVLNSVGRVSTQRGTVSTLGGLPEKRCLPKGWYLPRHPPGPRGRHSVVNRMTYRCENLTFPLQKPIHTVRQILKQNSFSHFSNFAMISSLEFFAFDRKFAKLAIKANTTSTYNNNNSLFSLSPNDCTIEQI